MPENKFIHAFFDWELWKQNSGVRILYLDKDRKREVCCTRITITDNEEQPECKNSETYQGIMACYSRKDPTYKKIWY